MLRAELDGSTRCRGVISLFALTKYVVGDCATHAATGGLDHVLERASGSVSTSRAITRVRETVEPSRPGWIEGILEKTWGEGCRNGPASRRRAIRTSQRCLCRSAPRILRGCDTSALLRTVLSRRNLDAPLLLRASFPRITAIRGVDMRVVWGGQCRAPVSYRRMYRPTDGANAAETA